MQSGSNINNSFAAFTQPSDVKKGFSFEAGVFVSRSIGKTWWLQSGINYSYASTHMQLGSKIYSSSGRAQYSNARFASYINQFHFIELPVIIEKQLGPASRFSINGGLALSFLLGSNALHFNQQSNIYYADNSLINKTQLNLVAGFHYRVLQRSIRLQAGPQLGFGLGNIVKGEPGGARHLLFAGFSTRIFFNKK